MIKDWDAIVITADEPFTGLHHTQILYANFLSKQVPVLYVGPPSNWHPLKILNVFIPWKNSGHYLKYRSYINLFPSKFKRATAINENLNAGVIAKQLAKLSAKKVLIWHFDSYRSVLLSDKLKPFNCHHLYHVIDPFFRNPYNEVLCRISKLIVITSPGNMQYYEAYKNKVVNIGQRIDAEAEQNAVNKPYALNVPEKPFLVLLGTISDDLDFDLLLSLAKEHSVCLVGKLLPLKQKAGIFEKLRALPGVEIYGPQKPEVFYKILIRAKAGLILYDTKIRSGHFTPLKAINYLIAGIPVISNCATEISAVQGKCIYEGEDQNQIKTWCSEAIKGQLPFDSAAKNSYLEKISLKSAVEQIMGILSSE